MSKLVKLVLGFVVLLLFIALAPSPVNGQAPDAGVWMGEYFNNQNLAGPPALVRNDPAINFDWGVGSPAYNIPVDHFSVRWTRNIYTTAGTWRLTATTDDGVRVWVDNNLVIDRWVLQSRTTWTADIPLSTGTHSVRIEYFENTLFAVAQFSFGPANTPPVPPVPPIPSIPSIPGQAVWHGQYFNNPYLAGPPTVVRDDPSLHFDWGYGSPDPRLPVDYFSAKWDSTQLLPLTGNYTILVSSDDGVRVWVDGTIVLDQWNDHPPTLFTVTKYLTAGAHNVHVEYYERTGTALLTVDGIPSAFVPPQPAGDVIVDDRGPGWQSGGSPSNWHSTNGYGGHAFWTFNNAFASPSYNWARWYPQLPRAGNYEVFAYIPGGSATTVNARYWISHAGRYDLAARAQAFGGERWLSLGTHYFAATGGEKVSLSDVTFECFMCRTVVYDAIKFSPR